MKETKKCLYCEKEFETEGSDVVCKKFCCYSCNAKYRRRTIKPYKYISLKCLECGKQFYPKYGYEHKTMFCCRKCKTIYVHRKLGKEHLFATTKRSYKKMMDNDILHSIHLTDKRIKSRQPNERFRAYKINAIKRNISFNLSFDQFLTFWDKPCHYCGSPIDGVGIDRVNNEIGYEPKNCVPCCSLCNRMKNNLSLSDFFSHIQIIINHTLGVSPKDSDEHRVKK